MRPWALAGPPPPPTPHPPHSPNNTCSRVSCWLPRGTACSRNASAPYSSRVARRVDEALTTGLKKLGSFRLPSLSRFVRSLIFGWPPVGYVSRPPSRVFELRDYLRLPWLASDCPGAMRSCSRGRLGSRKRVLVLAT